MTQKQFEEFVDGVFVRVRDLMSKKSNDYADKNNVFGNFERMSEKIKDVMHKDMDPSDVAEMMKLLKMDRIHNLLDSKKEIFNEGVMDSYLDEILYLLLEMGIVYEKSLKEKK